MLMYTHSCNSTCHALLVSHVDTGTRFISKPTSRWCRLANGVVILCSLHVILRSNEGAVSVQRPAAARHPLPLGNDSSTTASSARISNHRLNIATVYTTMPPFLGMIETYSLDTPSRRKLTSAAAFQLAACVPDLHTSIFSEPRLDGRILGGARTSSRHSRTEMHAWPPSCSAGPRTSLRVIYPAGFHAAV